MRMVVQQRTIMLIMLTAPDPIGPYLSILPLTGTSGELGVSGSDTDAIEYGE